MPLLNCELICDPDKTGSGTWYARWRENGKPQKKSLRTKDHGEAQKAYGRFLLDADKPQALAKGIEYTIADLWPIYLEKKLSKGRSARRAGYKWQFMGPYFGHLTPGQVTKSVVSRYVDMRKSGEIAGRKGAVQDPTVRGELTLLRACLHFCAQLENDQEQPMFDAAVIRKFDMPDHGKPRDRALTKEEIELMHVAARGRRKGTALSRGEIFLYLALGTAGREEAILGLTFDPKRVSFDNRFIDLNDGERLKNDKRRAVVHMNDDLYIVLRQALAESDQSIPLEKRLVCMNKSSIWAILQHIVRDAGLAPKGWVKPKSATRPKRTGISAHVLRHTAATHMAIAGIPLAHIAHYLGNTVEMVQKVYAHLQPEHTKAAADVMSRGLRVVPTREVA